MAFTLCQTKGELPICHRARSKARRYLYFTLVYSLTLTLIFLFFRGPRLSPVGARYKYAVQAQPASRFFSFLSSLLHTSSSLFSLSLLSLPLFTVLSPPPPHSSLLSTPLSHTRSSPLEPPSLVFSSHYFNKHQLHIPTT